MFCPLTAADPVPGVVLVNCPVIAVALVPVPLVVPYRASPVLVLFTVTVGVVVALVNVVCPSVAEAARTGLALLSTSAPAPAIAAAAPAATRSIPRLVVCVTWDGLEDDSSTVRCWSCASNSAILVSSLVQMLAISWSFFSADMYFPSFLISSVEYRHSR